MVTIILHTHLPYVLHHGNWPHGSDWLCEAVAECYIPLLQMCDRLLADGIRPGITFDISPILCEQLSHPDFPAVFETYCNEHGALARGDVKHYKKEADASGSAGGSGFAELALGWQNWYEQRLVEFQDDFAADIVGAFRRLQDASAIEMMTCGVTHGYMPLLAEEASVDMQVALAVTNYERHFGRRPRGIWLPECAYRPAYAWRSYLPVAPYSMARHRKGIEQFLPEHGLEYFVTDEGALTGSTPLGMRGPDGKRTPHHETFGDVRRRLDARTTLQVYRAGGEDHNQHMGIFTRHRQIALQVWSGETGYPGDPDYLDFHKRFFRSGLRYWRVTDNKADMQWKQPYVPEWAENRAKAHAAHFVEILEATARHHLSDFEKPPTICLPFDTELFGHWWFEGPLFVEHVLRGIHQSHLLSATTAGERYDMVHPDCEVALPESSWGRNGNHDVWMNPDVQWTWEKEYQLERRIRMLLDKHRAEPWDATMRRLIMNALREMLLAQASDWQFLISTFSSREYAQMRFHNHAADAMRLANAAERYAVSQDLLKSDAQLLEACEKRNGVLEADLNHYLSSHA